MKERLEQQMRFLVEIDKMKNIFRQTVIIDKSRFENDAEHSWHFAMVAMILFEYTDPKKVNLDRVLKMALVHDLVEVYAGDTFAYDEIGNRDKEERENKAAKKLFGMLPKEQGQEIESLWREFDAMETMDSKYASAIDRIQPFIQNYYTEGHSWRNRVTSDKVYKRMEVIGEAAPELWQWVQECIEDSIAKGFLEKGTQIG